MATQIVISRIQHRRGRRENLPQPLKPGELALTSDTRQVWIGGDPDHMPAGVLVYGDQDIAVAQSIIDTIIVEVRFDSDFNTNFFNSVYNALVNSVVMDFAPEDIIRDTTFRTDPPNTFEGYSIYIMADQSISPANTIANINAAIAGTPASDYWIESNYVGDLALFGGEFDEDGFLSLDTQGQAAAIAILVNRAYAPVPGVTAGLVTTNLNIEIGTGSSSGGGGFSGPLPYELGFYLGGQTTIPSYLYTTYVAVNAFSLLTGANSRAYANDPSSLAQTFDLRKNNVSFGSVQFLSGNPIGTVVIASPVSFIAGDRLDIIGPAVPDGTVGNIALTLSGELNL
jgi:hypothetical protein